MAMRGMTGQLRAYLPAFMAAALGVGLTVVATGLVIDGENARLRLEMERRVENHTRALTHGMAERVRLVEEVQGLYATAGRITDRDFHAYIGGMDLGWSGIRAFAWVPAPAPVDGAALPHPVRLCEPEPSCAGLVGLDLAADGELRDAFARSLRLGASTVAAPVVLPPAQATMLAVVAPVGRADDDNGTEPGDAVAGFAVGLFPIADLVESILNKQTAPSGLDVYLFGQPHGALEPFHFHPSRAGGQAPTGPMAHRGKADGRFWRHLNVADREWSVAFEPVPGAIDNLRSNETVQVAVFGLLLTTVLVVYLVMSVRRTVRIGGLVASRTAELHRANDALREQTATVQFLRTMAVCANEATSIEAALETGLGEICDFTGWPVGHAYALAPERTDLLHSTGIWSIRAGANLSRFVRATEMAEVGRGAGLAGQVLETGQAVVLSDRFAASGDPRGPLADDLGLVSGVGVPIAVGNEVVAVMEFFAFEPLDGADGIANALALAGSQLGRVVERAGAAERLRGARDEAEQANVAKSKFLAAASHDLRQPLQAMNLFVNVLAGRHREGPDAEIVHHLGESVGALEGLLNAFLNISKLEAGLVVPHVADFSLGGMLNRLAAEFLPLAQRAGLDLRVVPSTLVVRSDPVLVERILMNFLSNAVRYTDRGAVLIGCRRRGGAVRVGVWDTGVGIPGKQRRKVFREFHRVETPGRRSDEGLGLGLAIVERLARLLGHPVHVESVPGRGSLFAVDLPLAMEGANGRALELAGLVPTLPRRTAEGTVLVIDDDPQICLAVRLQLESWGFRVLTAATIAEAIKCATAEATPNLILADYRLRKGETGNKAINAVRSKTGAKIPGILFSGDTAPKRLRKAQKSGFRLLHKPVRPDVLQDAIAREIEGD
ncbi:MAG: CHASE domain-containing protein [Hyphomicrobiales bacterium]|nr:CHASE domain-containing protein [Hyphomicrobiales bacterium]MCP5371798.1 CHASE domain-containing protein [Hyphomicrobiales bacterium]